MSVNQALSDAMGRVGSSLDLLRVVEFGDREAWGLVFDEKTMIEAELDAKNSRLVLSAEVGSPPAAEREKTLTLLLRYNSAWTEHGGLRFALDADTQAAFLMLDIAVERAEVTLLCRILQNLRETVESWRTIFETAGAAAQAQPLPFDTSSLIRV